MMVRTTARGQPPCSAGFRTPGGLADFASLLAPGTSTDASRAQELLIGREILDALARQQGFVTDASGNDDIALARERLGENLDTEYLFESDLLVISYDHYYPDQAAAGLEFAVERLREKMHALTIERVRRRKIFLDERLAEVRQDRTEAQDALTEFQQEFGVINLAAQSESAIESVTALKTELYRKEVELHSQIELLGENTAAVVRSAERGRHATHAHPGRSSTASSSSRTPRSRCRNCPRWGSAIWIWPRSCDWIDPSP